MVTVRRRPRRHVLPGVRRLARRHGRLGRARQRQRVDAAGLLQRPEPHSVPVVVPELRHVRHDDQHHGDAVRRPVERRRSAERRPWGRPGRIRPSARSRTRRARTPSSTGSGFLPRSVENGSTRGGATAGQKLYLLSAEDGHVYASRSSVGNDGVGETDDDCAAMTLRLHEVQERAAGRPGGHRAERRALHHQGVHRRSRRQHLAVRHRPRRLEATRSSPASPRRCIRRPSAAQPIFSSMAAGLGRHAGVPLRRHRQRPAAVAPA